MNSSLGALAERGEGMPKDEALAAKWREEARRQGSLVGPLSPPPPPPPLGVAGGVVGGVVGGTGRVVDFDFSQLKVKQQPPPVGKI